MVLRARQVDADVMKMRVTLNWKTSLKRMKQESTALMVYASPSSFLAVISYSQHTHFKPRLRDLIASWSGDVRITPPLPSVQRASEAQHPWGQAVVISADLVPQSRCARELF